MKKLALTTIAASLCVVPALDANALPINPLVKTPALHGLEDITLAYDNVYDDLLYFAPDQYKVATSEGGIGHAGFQEYVDDDGNTSFEINAQFESHLTGTDLHRATTIIEAAGFRAAPLPLTYTHLKPAMTEFNDQSGDFCSMMFDEDEGEEIMVCSDLWDKVRTRNPKAPAVQGNLIAAATLSPQGAASLERNFLTGDLGFIFDGESKFYQAGTAWTAKVHVNYSLLLSAYHEYVAKHGKKETIVSENFLREEVLCATGYGHKSHSKEPYGGGHGKKKCGVEIEYFDCWGVKTKGPDLDPTNYEHKELVYLINELVTKLENDMFSVVYDWSPDDHWDQGDFFAGETAVRHSKPKRGYRVSEVGYQFYREINRTYTFRAEASVDHEGRLYAPASIDCLVREDSSGEVIKNKAGACAAYWADNPCHGFTCENPDEVCVVKVTDDIPGTKCVPAPVVNPCEDVWCGWGEYCAETGDHAGYCVPWDPDHEHCPDGCADDEYCVVDVDDNSECKPKVTIIGACHENDCDPVTEYCEPREDAPRGYICLDKVTDPCNGANCAVGTTCVPDPTSDDGFACVDNCGLANCGPTEVCEKDSAGTATCVEICNGVTCAANEQCFAVNGQPDCLTACQRMEECPADTLCKDEPDSFARVCKNPCEITECQEGHRCEPIAGTHKAECVVENPCANVNCGWGKKCKVTSDNTAMCVKKHHYKPKKVWWW